MSDLVRPEEAAALDAFMAWAKDNLGQGYSLERDEGTFVYPVTRWAFKGFAAAMERSAQIAESMTARARWAKGASDAQPTQPCEIAAAIRKAATP